MDKWQKREAEKFAEDNGVGFDAAVKELFPAEAGTVRRAPKAPAKEPVKEPANP